MKSLKSSTGTYSQRESLSLDDIDKLRVCHNDCLNAQTLVEQFHRIVIGSS